MANLIVRNLDQNLVQALKARAGQHGISAEAEHRKILESALMRPRKKSFSEVMQQIPDVGQDSDFEPQQDDQDRDLFS